jgi:hypothetical protein
MNSARRSNLQLNAGHRLLSHYRGSRQKLGNVKGTERGRGLFIPYVVVVSNPAGGFAT